MKMFYSLGDCNDAIFQARPHEDIQAQVDELLETSPFLRLDRSAKTHTPERKPGQATDNFREMKRKAVLESIDAAQHGPAV